MKKFEWEKGLGIVLIKTTNTEKPFSLIYSENNYLQDSEGNKVWFNEGIFPNVYVGMVIELKMMKEVLSGMYEVLSILED